MPGSSGITGELLQLWINDFYLIANDADLINKLIWKIVKDRDIYIRNYLRLLNILVHVYIYFAQAFIYITYTKIHSCKHSLN